MEPKHGKLSKLICKNSQQRKWQNIKIAAYTKQRNKKKSRKEDSYLRNAI